MKVRWEREREEGRKKNGGTHGLTDYCCSSPEVINNQSSLVHVLFRVTRKMQDSPLFIQLALCCQITARWLWPRAAEHFASLLQDCKLYILIVDQQSLSKQQTQTLWERRWNWPQNITDSNFHQTMTAHHRHSCSAGEERLTAAECGHCHRWLHPLKELFITRYWKQQKSIMVLPPLGLATFMLCRHTYINRNVRVCAWLNIFKKSILKKYHVI